jgi:S-formylglutathione hydrolase FrmB
MMRLLFVALSFFLFLTSFAGSVDTVNIYSTAMKKSYKAVVIKPNSYSDKSKKFETVYLLHGHGGSFSNWVKLVPALKQYADQYQLLIVCPEGSRDSWYFDSPIADSVRFETYIAKEVPAYVDAHYKTIADRNARAITGLSMGGHGGLFLGMRHADQFAGCGSMSGALLIEYISDPKYGIDKLLGPLPTNKQMYVEHSVMNELDNFPTDSLAIIIDCGVDDYVIEMNRMVHRKMVTLKIPHDYTERPGKHNWDYWRSAVGFQLLYFRQIFDSKKKG